MSEREPGSAPKPRPGRQEAYYPDSIAHLEAAFAEPSATNLGELTLATEPTPATEVVAANLVEEPILVGPSSETDVVDAEVVSDADVVDAEVVLEPTVVGEPVQPAERPAFNFVDKRNAASQAWSQENREAEEAKLDRELAEVEATAIDDPTEVETPAAANTEAPVEPEAAAEVIAPKRGELSHHDYHAQRPSEGIIRNGKILQNTATGKIASKEAYEEQTGIREFANGPVGLEESAQKHYDEVMGLNEAQPATPERPSYETMDVDQLAFAAAKAEMIGDKYVTDEIRNVYVTTLEEEYTRPGSEVTLDEFEAGVARFDRMVEAATAYEKAKDPEHSALVDAAVERANKEPSLGDKLKGWWGKHKEGIKNVFRPSYWGERFTAAQMKIGEAGTWALNLGVNEEDDDQEKDRKRNRNRVIFIAGGAGLALAGIAAATIGVGIAIGGNGEHHLGTEAANNVNGTGTGGSGTTGAETGGTGSGTGLSAQERAAQIATQPSTENYSLDPITGPTGAEQAVQDAAAKAAETAAYTVPVDGTGEHLLTSLNIDPAKWYPNQENFLKISEGHMYRMTDGSVGLRPGLLPEAVRNAIKALK